MDYYEGWRVMDDLSEAIDSMRATVARMSRDMASDHRDAWVYGILFGWGDAALAELAKQHGWTFDEVAKLRRLSAAIAEVTP